MKKITLALMAAATLSACVGSSGSNATVTQGDVLTTSCGIANMQTINGLPMRCGPQAASPYTMR